MSLDKMIRAFMKRNPLIVNPDSNIKEVATLMVKKGKDVAVVRDDEGIVRSLITASTLLNAIMPYITSNDLIELTHRDIEETKIQEIMKMTKDEEFMESCGFIDVRVCVSLYAWESVTNAIKVMTDRNLHHIIIVDEGGIVGTLSDIDLIKAFV